jgi:hypothetical protein
MVLPTLWWNCNLDVYICTISTETWVYAEANFTIEAQTSGSFFFMVSICDTMQD